MNGRARCFRSGWLARVAVIVPGLVLVFAATEPVSAQVQRLTGEDLDIVVDSRWAGTPLRRPPDADLSAEPHPML